MTEQEAKLILDVRISRFDHANDVNEALEVAKAALEEIQQYRALGTVEDIKQVIRDFNVQIEHSEHLAEVLKSTKSILSKREKLLREYSEIGTVEELREAMEKQKPKKPVEDRCAEHIHYKCKCGYIFRTEYTDGLRAGCMYHCCPNCGQAICWEEADD